MEKRENGNKPKNQKENYESKANKQAQSRVCPNLRKESLKPKKS